MNAVYEFDLVREHQIHMTLPSLTYYYNHKNDLAGIHVHLEFENLLHRSGFKDLNEIKEVLKDHHHNQNAKMIISGLWTHLDMLMNSMCQIIMLNVHNGWILLKHFYLKVISST